MDTCSRGLGHYMWNGRQQYVLTALHGTVLPVPLTLFSAFVRRSDTYPEVS